MTARTRPASVLAALLEAVADVLPQIPVEAGPATVEQVTPERVLALPAEDGAVAIALRTGGSAPGELVLVVPEVTQRTLAGVPGTDDAAATWGPLLTDLVAALSDRLGPIETDVVRPIELTAGAVADDALGAEVTDLVGRSLATMLFTPATVEIPAARAPEPAAFSPLTVDVQPPVDPRRLHLLRDVMMGVSVELGRTRMTVRELLSLSPGTIVQLDRAAGSPVDLLVNGTLLARGEVVVVDEEFAVRVTEIVSGAEGRLGA
jgi:flagellar motor switch protein FliN/FliY